MDYLGFMVLVCRSTWGLCWAEFVYVCGYIYTEEVYVFLHGTSKPTNLPVAITNGNLQGSYFKKFDDTRILW